MSPQQIRHLCDNMKCTHHETYLQTTQKRLTLENKLDPTWAHANVSNLGMFSDASVNGPMKEYYGNTMQPSAHETSERNPGS